MSKHGKRRSSAQIARDRHEISRYYLHGFTQAEIADMLGISQPTVSRDITAIEGEWREAAGIDIELAKTIELARIEMREREYMDAWERSKGSRQSSVTEKVTAEKGERTKAQLRQEQLLGDPRFLTGLESCSDQRCKILGLYASSRYPNLNLDVTQLTTEQLERIAAGENPIYVFATPSESRD